MTTSSNNNGHFIEGLKAKDFATDQDVRWCPGCGDYSILKQVQTVLADQGKNKDDVVFISGIGCSSRFPYYMNTYGMHSIHGRAPAIASGLKMANPDLDIWVITGDGDALSIGGNHFMHVLRRNFNLNMILFNNQIYGLTKGQYSPTSEENKRTASTPYGSLDHPVNPVALALGSDGTFIARSMDRDVKHLKEMLLRSMQHRGTSFLEVYQNCNIFNDGAFFTFTEKDAKPDNVVFLEHEKPLVFGSEHQKGIKLDGTTPVVVDLSKGEASLDDLWIHDEGDQVKAQILSRIFGDPSKGDLPRPFGVFYETKRPTYEDLLFEQIESVKSSQGEANLDALLAGNATWTIG
jgi:2-oxoglutarate ferredoxin oxidoreductase subunit beta